MVLRAHNYATLHDVVVNQFILCFKMAVVHVSHMINAAPLVADNARDESIQQKVRSYPQRSNLLDDDFKYASSVSSGSSKLTPISFLTRPSPLLQHLHT